MKLLNADKFYSPKGLSEKQREIRNLAMNNFEAFIRLVAPYQLLSSAHCNLCKWIETNPDVNLLLLWPRDHGKSRTSAFYTAWEIIRDPSTTIIYASATAEKAEEQLRFVKDILESKSVFRYFPGLIHPEEGRREAWNKTFIIIDHSLRKTEGVVDSTVMTCGLEKTITGKHCKKLILDDVVVPENNTEQGRKDVGKWCAQAISIMSAHSSMLVVGTRYHPRDAYQMMIDMKADVPVENKEGEIVIEPEDMFLISIADVEIDGDFLWPRQQRKDGKWFGFNARILARKRAVYEAAGEITQFYAQYYNDPNDKTTAPIARDLFKYYDRKDLVYQMGLWTVKTEEFGPELPLYVYAAVDLATGTQASNDYSVVTVGGIDDKGNRFCMDIKRFKTDKISVMLSHLMESYQKYHFKKLRIEAVSGFKLVATDLADNLYDKGVRIPIDFYIPPNTEAKPVRINGILEPLYQAGAVYHYRGGNCQILEDEICSAQPMNDDTKDSWAMCLDIMKKPMSNRRKHTRVVNFHPKWGGVAA